MPRRTPGRSCVSPRHRAPAGRARPSLATGVEAMESRLLMAAFTVTSTADAGPGTLREAILQANAAPGPDQVRFNIPPGPTPYTIRPLTPLPTVEGELDIHGRSQPGTGPYDHTIRVDGELAGPSAVGLRLTGRGSRVFGLRIDGFGSHGVVIDGGGDNVIEGSVVGGDGGDIAGNVNYRGNGGSGVVIVNSTSNTIGSPDFDTARLNVISGNGGWGVEIRGAEARQNSVAMNMIGTRLDEVPLGNAAGGVLVDGGVENYVGVAPYSPIGPVISGNGGPGVKLTNGAARNRVGVCHVGASYLSDATATPNYRAIGNGAEGVLVNGGASDNEIIANVIVGNPAGGVVISDAGTERNVLEGNMIGTDYSGTADSGNGPAGAGVFLRAANNRVGTDQPDARLRNTIAHNAGGGIVVTGNATGGTPPAGNTILGNSIHSNGGLGIDLRNDGVTPNDDGDADRGPNNLQNYPVITRAARVSYPEPWPAPAGLATRVQGAFNSTPNSTFRLRFYSGPADAVGFGEGRTYLGWVEVTTDAAGNVNFDVTIPAGALPRQQLEPAGAGESVTATATAPDGSTSEFSNARLVPGVVDRHIFYNGSLYDGRNPAATPEDDNAIAPDVHFVLPLGYAARGAYTTYYKGINGIMVDMAGIPAGAALRPEDFAIKVLPRDTVMPEYTEGWPAGPAPSRVVVRPGAGTGGSDRVTLLWPDGSIRNAWVRVEVKPIGRTGLDAPDVFYYGNLAGDATGGGDRDTETVNALDLAEMRRAISFVGTRPVDLRGPHDMNRDGRLNALDLAVIKANLGARIPFFTPRLPTPPPPPPWEGAAPLPDGGATDLLD